ncbi:unnamed protein product [Nippostrongylus brasiliensis]|uniref:Macro domain-containing protein n=1 Tax=Nippostrongylus brasiliensis TaxID=27835 RepID=A0A0N4YJM5_NIPBR|nr:unnamed protein product [Nippostrongylus brasiliensis]
MPVIAEGNNSTMRTSEETEAWRNNVEVEPTEEELLRTPEDEEMDDENVEHLRHKVEHLGNECYEEAARKAQCGGEFSVDTDTAIDLDSLGPEVLRELAERKLRAGSSNRTIVGHRPFRSALLCFGWTDVGKSISQERLDKLSSALAAAARNGTKILAVAPPRGYGAYERNRVDMNETLELAKSVAVLAKQNIISYIPAIESAREPSHGPGARLRNSSSEKYSKEVLTDYFESLNNISQRRAGSSTLGTNDVSKCSYA